MHKGDIQKDKEIAGKLNNVFASVFTLENQATEEKEEKTYCVKERPRSNRDIKGSLKSETRREGICQVPVKALHSPEPPAA